jgi:membrane protease YdiL (CAAX protease family)
MLLPAGTPVEAIRPQTGARQVFDVIGGVAFALLVFEIMRWHGLRWLHIDPRDPWANVGAEVIFLIPALLVGLVLKSGIRHDISVRSTFEALKLDWPELTMALWTLASVHAMIGTYLITPGTLWLALAVGTVEEFFFRVVLLGWLVTRVSAPAALVISSLLFGFAHSQFLTAGDWAHLGLADIVNVVPQISGGFVLGAIYLRTRNPIGPILAHAMWDFPLFMQQEAIFGGGGIGGDVPLISVPQMLPWLGFIVYGLWLIRDGVPLAGRIEPVGRGAYLPAERS